MPTPTDPRERKDFATLLAEWLRERAKECAELQSTNSNLAAEIAELKGEVEALKSDLHTAQTEATGYWRQVEEWKEAHRGLMLSALRGLGESEDLLPAANQAFIESQGASLRTQLEAARKERDERKADLKMFMEMHDTALAAKDAAEKRVAELVALINELVERSEHNGRIVWIHKNPTFMPLSLSNKIAAALTPAPTQEPPAGGVTISNDIERPIEVAGANDEGQKSQPSDVTISTEKKGGEAGMFIESPPMKGASDVRPEGRPAYVPSEGRGEPCKLFRPLKSEIWGEGKRCQDCGRLESEHVTLLPFNLSDALAGKPVVTRDGRRVNKLKVGEVMIDVWTANAAFTVWKDGNYHTVGEHPLDLFMLPTEGSGA